MHTPSIFVAAVALLSTFAVADERPKFYFPRQIKRQVVRNNIAQVTRRDVPTIHRRQFFDANGILPPGAANPTGDTTIADAGAPVSASDTNVVVPSTTSPSDGATTTDGSSAQTSTPDTGIVFSPGGVSTSDPTDAKSDSSTDSTTNPSTTDPSASPSTTADPQPTDSGITGPVSGTDPATTTAPDPAAATSTDGGGLGVLTSIGGDLSSILNPTTTADPATTSVPPAAPTTTADPNVSTSTPPDPLSSILSQITQTSTSLPITTPAVSVTNSATNPPITVSPTVTASNTVPTSTSGPVPPVTLSDTAINNSTTPVTTTSPSGAAITSTSLSPGVTTNGTSAGTAPATIQTTPVGINTSGVSPSVTDTAPTVTPSTNATVVPVTSASITDDVSLNPAKTGTELTTSVAPQTILPTSTDAATSQFVPSVIIIASSPTATGAVATTESGIPSALPKVIAPPNGVPTPPVDNTLIQIGFLYPLNYKFVVSQWKSQVQIFKFLPEGIADGLGISEDKVIMHSLVPYDTTSTLGYITTLSLAYIPTNLVDKLRIGLHTPLSALYQNPDGSVNTLMNLINPAIDIIPGSTLAGGGSSGTDGGAAATPSGAGGGGIFNTDEQTAAGTKKAGQVAAVAIGAAVGAAAYGAAMFFIARRYKRKRSLHRRSSSIINPAEMRLTGSPPLMGGALAGRTTPGTDRNSRGSGRTGNSVRTAQISAPMMAENSLGWN